MTGVRGQGSSDGQMTVLNAMKMDGADLHGSDSPLSHAESGRVLRDCALYHDFHQMLRITYLLTLFSLVYRVTR